MELKEVASISGKSGLFKILKPIRNGVILESLDDQKVKLVANSNSKVSILNEISMYTTGKVSNTPLEEILVLVKAKYPKGVDLDTKIATTDQLKSFLKGVLPDFDEDKVYGSDIKKLVNWYNILLKHAPEVLEAKKEEEQKEEVVVEGESKPKKATKVAKEGVGAKTKVNTTTKIKSSQNTSQKNVTKSTPSKRGG